MSSFPRSDPIEDDCVSNCVFGVWGQLRPLSQVGKAGEGFRDRPRLNRGEGLDSKSCLVGYNDYNVMDYHAFPWSNLKSQLPVIATGNFSVQDSRFRYVYIACGFVPKGQQIFKHVHR